MQHMSYVESLLGTNETILRRNRQHWIIWVPTAAVCVVVAILVVVLAGAIHAALPNIGLIALALLLIPLYSFLRTFLNWLREEFVITNWRIMQVRGVLNKQVLDSSLDKINDVSMQQTLLGRMLDFGDINVLTASEQGINRIRGIRDPIGFKVVMVNAKEALRGRGND